MLAFRDQRVGPRLCGDDVAEYECVAGDDRDHDANGLVVGGVTDAAVLGDGCAGLDAEAVGLGGDPLDGEVLSGGVVALTLDVCFPRVGSGGGRGARVFEGREVPPES